MARCSSSPGSSRSCSCCRATSTSSAACTRSARCSRSRSRTRRRDPAAAQAAAGRGAVPGAAQPAHPRRRLAALRGLRRARHRPSPGSSSSSRTRRRATPGSAGSRSASSSTSSTGAAIGSRRSPRRCARRFSLAPRSRSSTGRSSCRSSPAPSRTRRSTSRGRLAAERGATIVALRVIVVPLDQPLDAELPSRRRRPTGCSTRRRRWASLRRAHDRPRRPRPQRGPAIVEEAERRQAEIIVLGAPRGRHRDIFGKTVDYVLKNAPCRVMVAAREGGRVTGRPYICRAWHRTPPRASLRRWTLVIARRRRCSSRPATGPACGSSGFLSRSARRRRFSSPVAALGRLYLARTR